MATGLWLQPTSVQEMAPSVPTGHPVSSPGGGNSINGAVQSLVAEVAAASPNYGFSHDLPAAKPHFFLLIF